jgi:hypothetical protein
MALVPITMRWQQGYCRSNAMWDQAACSSATEMQTHQVKDGDTRPKNMMVKNKMECIYLGAQ